MTRKTSAGIISVAVLGLLIAGSAFAAGPKGMMKGRVAEMGKAKSHLSASMVKPVLIGKVTAINGNTLTVSGRNNASYTIDATNAKITKAGAAIQISGIQVNDTVLVTGTMNGTSVAATAIRDEAEKQVMAGRKMFSGTITAINGSSFTLQLPGKKVRTVTVNDGSASFSKDGASAASSDLAVGQKVTVAGSLDSAKTTLTATKVSIVTPKVHIKGTVQSVSGNSLTVLGKNGTTYTVDGTNAKVVDKEGKASLTALQVNDSVRIQGKAPSGSNNVSAKLIVDSSR